MVDSGYNDRGRKEGLYENICCRKGCNHEVSDYFLITVSALLGSGDYISEVSKNLVKKELPVYSVERADKKIALTFDNAWDNADIPSILDTLKNDNIKATFFVTGGWIRRYPESAKAIIDGGHELGNHSATHPHIARLGKDEVAKEIMDVHNKVKELFGVEMKNFRPPYGEYNDMIVRVTRSLGYQIVQWDVDTLT